MSKWISFFLSIVCSASLYAKSVEFMGTHPLVISVDNSYLSTPSYSNQIVFVQSIRLSEEAQQVLRQRLDNLTSEDSIPLILEANNIPARVNLGMNATPVLDQGAHGSCVTFAITGAIDAVIGKGDYISQLCSLELGDYLEQKGLIQYSGWNGSMGLVVLNQLNKYGIMAKSYQQKYGCSGVTQYPLANEKNTGKAMSISEYTANSKSLSRIATWEVLLDIENAFSNNHNPDLVLRAVKQNIREGKRVTFGMLLDDSKGDVGAFGSFKKNLDTWVLTPEIIKKAKNEGLHAGHEMIIIGYDDKALAKTKNGKISKGLFIVRNSWGNKAGDGGNFYISYDYFKAFSDEAQALIPN